MKKAKFTFLCFIGILTTNTALACDGVFDPQTGICHQTNGYQIPGQVNKGQPKARDFWGAIAIDSAKGESSGSALNHTDRNSAEKAALKQCDNSRDCRIAISFKNSCGAVASNGQGVDIGAYDPNPIQAERKALAACNKQSRKVCGLWVKASCSGTGY